MIQLTDRQTEEILLTMRKSYWEMRRQKCSLAACNRLAKMMGMLDRKYRHGKKKA